MSAIEVKTPVKPQFELELKCLMPESSTLLTEGNTNTVISSSRPMVDLENNRDPERFNNVDEDEDKGKLAKVDKFSYPPVHRKRPRFLSQSRSAEIHHNKKRRKGNEKIILPTKFLLGGNINDPLNLNSLCDEEVSRALNERTPQSSPVPTPAHRRDVTLIMPRNQFDPLNLNEPDMENEPLTSSKACAKRKKRHHKSRKKNDPNIENTNTPTTPITPKESEKKKHLAEALKIEIDDDASVAVKAPVKVQPQDSKPKAPQVPTTLSVSGTVHSTPGGVTATSTEGPECAAAAKATPENKIVSPVIPQLSPKNRKRRLASTCESRCQEQNPISSKNLNRSESCPGDVNKTAFARKNRRRHSHRGSCGNKKGQTGKSKSYRFIYGNYNRYYGYRNPDEHDSRTNAFKMEWFEDKRVLDIGCNVGHLTLFLAREFKPEMILGLDIDGRLIAAARKNIRHYLMQDDSNKYPNSCKLSYGPLVAPVKQQNRRAAFPHNISFAQGSYVLESDELLSSQKPEYDLILCMSLTKWIHLNWGDDGLKRSFKRMYRQLRPGGKLILEPQSWSSYKKRRQLTETIYNNFCKLKLKPDNFADYLTSPEVGFSNYEIIDVPFNKSKGFQRPIYLFYKDHEEAMVVDKALQEHHSYVPTEPSASVSKCPLSPSEKTRFDWSASDTPPNSLLPMSSSSPKDPLLPPLSSPSSQQSALPSSLDTQNTVAPPSSRTTSSDLDSSQRIDETASAAPHTNILTNGPTDAGVPPSTNGGSTPVTTLPEQSGSPLPSSSGVPQSSLAINSSSSSPVVEASASTEQAAADASSSSGLSPEDPTTETTPTSGTF